MQPDPVALAGPMTAVWHICDLEDAVECFKEGLTPLETLIELNAEGEDGTEKDFSAPKTTPSLLEPLMWCALFIALIAGSMMIYTSIREARAASMLLGS